MIKTIHISSEDAAAKAAFSKEILTKLLFSNVTGLFYRKSKTIM